MATHVTARYQLSAQISGNAINVEGTPAGQLWAHVTGDLVGDAVFEVSLDGDNWAQSAATPSLDTYQVIPELAAFVRVTISTYTSGTLAVVFGAYTPQ